MHCIALCKCALFSLSWLFAGACNAMNCNLTKLKCKLFYHYLDFFFSFILQNTVDSYFINDPVCTKDNNNCISDSSVVNHDRVMVHVVCLLTIEFVNLITECQRW